MGSHGIHIHQKAKPGEAMGWSQLDCAQGSLYQGPQKLTWKVNFRSIVEHSSENTEICHDNEYVYSFFVAAMKYSVVQIREKLVNNNIYEYPEVLQ